MADTLSRLNKEETPLKDTMEAFYSIMEALPTHPNEESFSHNLVSFEKLEKAQHKDSQIKQNIKDDKYHCTMLAKE